MMHFTNMLLSFLILFSCAANSMDLAEAKKYCPKFGNVKIGKGETDVRTCKVSEFSSFWKQNDETFYYGLYCLIPGYAKKNVKCGGQSFDSKYYANRASAVYVKKGDSNQMQLIFERADSEVTVKYYEKPEVIEFEGKQILYLPIHIDGTGAGNESEYYIRRESTWIKLETDSWVKEVFSKAPAGTRILKGVWPDLHTMKAEAGLYREGDANCCPSGGSLQIDLKLDDTKLAVKAIKVLPPNPEDQ